MGRVLRLGSLLVCLGLVSSSVAIARGWRAPHRVLVVSGSGQEGLVGEVLPRPLVARVVDRRGRSVRGVQVQFVVVSGGGAATPVSVRTNRFGKAVSQFTLGPSAGAHAVEARVAGLAGSARFDATAGAGSACVEANADTWVSSHKPNKNFGGQVKLRVSTLKCRRSLVSFDQTELADAVAGENLLRATLEVTVLNTQGPWYGLPFVSAHRMKRPWAESGATWRSANDPNTGNNVPEGPLWFMGYPWFAPFSLYPSDVERVTPGHTTVLRFNVTGDVQAFLDGSRDNHGWLLKRLVEYPLGGLKLASRESGTPPKLVLVFEEGGDTTPPSVAWSAPAPGACVGPTAAGTLDFSDTGSGIDASSLDVTLDGNDVSGAFTPGGASATASLGAIPGLSDGTHTLVGTISDNAGNAASASVTFDYDGTPPTLVVTPADGTSVVSSDTVSVSIAFDDLGCGVDPGTLQVLVDGVAATGSFTVGPNGASAEFALSPGTHTASVSLSDLAGNTANANATFDVVRTGELRGLAFGGPHTYTLAPITSARVTALTPEAPTTYTDSFGRFVLEGVRAGSPVTVVVDGLEQGFGRTTLVVEVTPGAATESDRAWVLTEVDFATGTPLSVDSNGFTTQVHTITHPDFPAQVVIPAGVQVTLPAGVQFPPGTAPTLSLSRQAVSSIPNPLPNSRFAPVFYALEPQGTIVQGGFQLTLPNDQDFVPGAVAEGFVFDAAAGVYQSTSLTVDPSGATLSGPGGSTFGLAAAAIPGIEVSVTDQVISDTIAPVRLLVQYGGVSLGRFLAPVAASETYAGTIALPNAEFRVDFVVAGEDETFVIPYPACWNPGTFQFIGTPLPQQCPGTNPSAPNPFPTVQNPLPPSPPVGPLSSGDIQVGFVPPPPLGLPDVVGPGTSHLLNVAFPLDVTQIRARSRDTGDEKVLGHTPVFGLPGGNLFITSPASEAPNPPALPDGRYSLLLDRSTTSAPQVMDNFYYTDATGPVVDSLIIPGALGSSFTDLCVGSNSFQLALQLSDPTAGIASYTLREQGVATPLFDLVVPGTTPGTRNAPSLSLSVSPSVTLAEGTHVLELEVRDLALPQNVTVFPLTVTVDTVAPGLVETFPTPFLSSTPITVSFSASDNLEIDRVELRDGTDIVATANGNGTSTLVGNFPNVFIPGSATLDLVAFDCAGNTLTRNGPTYTFDDQDPTATVTFSGVLPRVVSMNFDDTGGTSVSTYQLQRRSLTTGFAVTLVPPSAPSGPAPHSESFSDGAALPDGRYVYELTVLDGVNNQTVAVSPEFAIDTAPPTISFVGIFTGQVLGPVTTADPNAPIVRVEDAGGVLPQDVLIRLDGTELPPTAVTGPSPVGGTLRTDLTATFGNLPNGFHTLTVDAVDTSGQPASNSVTFFVDNDAPLITSFLPDDVLPIRISNSSSQTFSAAFVDNETPLASAVTLISNGVASNVTGLAVTTQTSMDITLTLADGLHQLFLAVVDSAGNPAVAVRQVVIDTGAPTVTVSGPAPLPTWVTDTTPDFSASFADGIGGAGIDLASISVLLDGLDVSAQAVITPLGLSLRPGTPLIDGPHQLVVSVADRAGNTASDTVNFQIDATAPSVPGVPVVGAHPVEPTTTLRWTASTDALSGFSGYRVERSEDAGLSFTTLATTTLTELVVDFPVGEGTRFRVLALDVAGNASAPAEALGCEVAGLDSLTTPVTTTLQVQVLGGDSSPITSAVVTETNLGIPLVHQGGGVYTSAPLNVASGQPLRLEINVNGDVFVSGPLLPLLPETTLTDFGVVSVAGVSLSGQVITASGRTPGPGQAGLGGTLGEPLAAGPPLLSSSNAELGAGFWHGAAAEGEAPAVNVLQVPPVLCSRYVPVYFELFTTAGTVDLEGSYSLDGGLSFLPMTLAAGGFGNLPGTPLGLRHVVLWDAGSDLAGVASAELLIRVNPLGQPTQGSTQSATLFRAFSVASVSPASGSLNLDPAGGFTLGFTAPVTASVANLASSIVLVDAETETAVPLTFGVAGNQVTVSHGGLANGTRYTLGVFEGLQTAAGSQPLAFDQDVRQPGVNPFLAHFATGGASDPGLVLVSSTPSQGASGISVGTPIQLKFSQALDPASVSDSTIRVTSASEGNLPVTVVLEPDLCTVTISTGLLPGRLYTVSASSVTDAAGDPLAQLVAVSFVTQTDPLLTPAAPTITSPTGGTVTANPLVITGTGPPNHEIRLVVNGVPIGPPAAVDASGNWTLEPAGFPPGTATVFAVASGPGGAPVSPASGSVTFDYDGGELNTTPPAGGGEPQLHEVLVGAGSSIGAPPHAVTLTFTGTPGASVSLQIETEDPAQAGIDLQPTVTVPPANGGGPPDTISPGIQAIPNLMFDLSGEFTVTYTASDLVDTAVLVTLLDTFTGAAITPTQRVIQRVPMAFISVSESFPLSGPANVTVNLRARLLQNGTYGIYEVTNYPLTIFGFPVVNGVETQVNAVNLNGVDAVGGVQVVTDASGTAVLQIEHVMPEISFFLRASAAQAFSVVQFEIGGQEFSEFRGTDVGEEFFEVIGIVITEEGEYLLILADPAQNPNYGDLTTTVIRIPCPDPVFMHSGALTLSRMDMAIPGRGVHFAFSRTYKSNALYNGPMGQSWTHGYDQRLQQLPGGDIAWLTGTNRNESFQDVGGGRYQSPNGFYNDLRVVGGVGTIRMPNGSRIVFRSFSEAVAPGRLDEIQDRHGNRLKFDYGIVAGGVARLVQVTDPYEREVDFAYNPQGRIATITDFSGRVCRYDYGVSGDLLRVTSPAVTETTEGAPLLAENQFPDGKSEIYGYRGGFADERLNHNMFLIVAPNQARGVAVQDLENHALLTPLARMESRYEEDPNSPEYAKVVGQRLGGSVSLPAWTGQSVPQEAGGLFAMSYRDLAVPAGASLNHPVQATLLVDRNGNRREFFHNAAGQCVRMREYTNRNVRPESLVPLEGQDPPFYERSWLYNADGLLIASVAPLGGVTVHAYGQEDLNGDGLLTAGEDRNFDGDFLDPEDVQPEDSPLFAFDPGDGQLDALPRVGERNLLRVERLPDARGDSRGGLRSRVATLAYEPIYNQLVRSTDPRAFDPSYTPQNGGAASLARYTTTRFFDYQEGPAATALTALAVELGESEATVQGLLTQAGVSLGLGDLNGQPLDDARVVGDAVRAVAPVVNLVAAQTRTIGVQGDTTQEIVATSQFNQFGQLVQSVDPELNVHTVSYYPEADPDGDGVGVVDNTSTLLTGGYPSGAAADVAAGVGRNSGTNPVPTVITSSMRYDEVGNVVAATDPRGIVHTFRVNSLNQVVGSTVAANTVALHPSEPGSLAALSYESVVIYDANNNVIETRIENAGERTGDAAQVAANPFWAAKVGYDILDNPVISLAEVEPVANDVSLSVNSPGVIVSRVSYDSSENVQLVTKPEGNQLAYVYDERHLVFQAIDGFGSPEAGVYRVSYDLNGNQVFAVDAEKNNPGKDPGLSGDVTRRFYDGFDEPLCVIDAESNFGLSVFDPTGTRVRYTRFGPNEEGNPRLSEVEFLHDELGRRFQTEARIFETQLTGGSAIADLTIPVLGGGVPAGETEAIQLGEFDRMGRVIRGVDPKGDEALLDYDGASRMLRAQGPVFASRAGTGAVRNEVGYTYNQASQVQRVVQVDRSPVKADEVFEFHSVFDALGRVVRVTDPVGQTSRMAYDSRSNVIAASDAKSSVLTGDPLGLFAGSINGHGNVVRVEYDGISRPVRSDLALKAGGIGNGSLDLLGFTGLDTGNSANADGLITKRMHYDRNSRLLSQTDDNGNTTGSVWDSRDRVTHSVAADLTARQVVYDRDSLVRQSIDRNGTVIARDYDGLGRPVSAQVTKLATNLMGLSQNVEGTTEQAWEYDGLSRLRVAFDNNGVGADDVACSYTWDSLSRKVEERHRFNVLGSVTGVTTTSGRVSVIPTGATLDRTVASQYDVDSNRVGLTYSSGRQLTFGIDGADRIQEIFDGAGGGVAVAGWEFVGGRAVLSQVRNGVQTNFGYDAKRRVTSIDHVGVVSSSYGWDRANRRTFEAESTGRTESYSYDSAYRVTGVGYSDGTPATAYQIDGVGNWVARSEGGETTEFNRRQNGSYAFDVMNEQFRTATFDAGGALVAENTPVSDNNGNTIRGGDKRLFWDLFDRLVRVERVSDGVTLAEYRYDPAGRRTQKTAGGVEMYYVSDGAREIEELASNGAVVADYVFGGYVDHVVQMRRAGQEYYLHADSVFSVAAVTDATGSVVTRYGYDSVYGVSTLSGTDVGNPWRFQGRRLDSESGLYHFRNRYLDPTVGRFVSRDPIGLWGDSGNHGNEYAFCNNDPVNLVDPFGLWMPRGREAYDYQGVGNYPGHERAWDARWDEARERAALLKRLAPVLPYLLAEHHMKLVTRAFHAVGNSGIPGMGWYHQMAGLTDRLAYVILPHLIWGTEGLQSDGSLLFFWTGGWVAARTGGLKGLLGFGIEEAITSGALFGPETPSVPLSALSKGKWGITVVRIVTGGGRNPCPPKGGGDLPVIARSIGAEARPIQLQSWIGRTRTRYATRRAEAMGDAAQVDVDNLTARFRQGNVNPGIGTRTLGDGYFELRGANAGRVIVYQESATSFHIVGKFQGHARGDAANSVVINTLMDNHRQAWSAEQARRAAAQANGSGK